MDAVYFIHDTRFDKLRLQDCVLQYKHSGNEFLLRAILYKLKGTINYFLYYKTDYPDKHELLELFEDKLIDAINSYEPNSTAGFITYYNKCLSNALINHVKYKKQHLSLDAEYNNDNSFGESATLGGMLEDKRNHDVVNSEVSILLESLKDTLDDNEYRVCKVILQENHNLTQAEIANEIGLTVPAIRGIFSRLEKRFKQYGICKNNF
jgi:RNA polymerase sigma factor (sigma-70 family)